MWYHPLKTALDAFIDSKQDGMNGTYAVELYKGNINIVHRESPTALFSQELRSLKSKGFNQQACADAAMIRGLPFELLAKRSGMDKS